MKLVHIPQDFLPDVTRNAVIGCGHTSCDGGESVTIAADGNGVAHGIFESCTLEESLQSLRYGFLAGFIETVILSDIIECEVQIVVIAAYVTADIFEFAAGASQVDGHGCSFSPFESLRVVVGD